MTRHTMLPPTLFAEDSSSTDLHSSQPCGRHSSFGKGTGIAASAIILSVILEVNIALREVSIETIRFLILLFPAQ